MHKCAEIHDAMTTLTERGLMSSEQHIELGTSRSNRDFHDLTKIKEWFDEHDPFDMSDGKLRSLSSALTACIGDGINCDDTECVGANLQKQLDNASIAKASIKRSEQVKTLDVLMPGFKVDREKVVINPTILFTRLIAIVQREDNMSCYFEYELTTIPTSLFKDNAMRKNTKAQLMNSMTKSVSTWQLDDINQAKYVIDGGALMHRVKWASKST
jgi:hypothetical protein